MLLNVAELPEYLRAAARPLADADRRAIIDHLAAHPADGDLIEGTGGRRVSRGLSLFSCSQRLPIFALQMLGDDRVALRVEGDGADWRPVACAA